MSQGITQTLLHKCICIMQTLKNSSWFSLQQDKAESAEFKIAKVAMTNVLLWAVIW